MERRVAITGLGFISPIGNNRPSVTAHLREQRHGLSPVNWFPDCAIRLAGTIHDFDLSSLQRAVWTYPDRDEISRETLRSLPPHGVYALCAIEQALAEAGLSPPSSRTARRACSALRPDLLVFSVITSTRSKVPPANVLRRGGS